MRGPTRAFRLDLRNILNEYAGRPSILSECHNLGRQLGLRLLLKREDLNHTGSHKINNVLGQTLLAKRMGKTRIVAETGAGQHGVASATAAALMGLECKVYMGAVDVDRQALNVFRMRLLGSEVEAVESGSRTLKDAVNEAMRDWVATVGHSHYCLGSVMGPHPYPYMVRQFHRVIGEEAQRAVPRPARRRPRRRGGVRRRRLERDGHLHRFRRRRRPADRSGTRRWSGRQPRQSRCGPRHAQLSHAGRGGPGRGGPVDLGRPRLPGRRSRALVSRVDRASGVSVRHRRRGDRGVPADGAQRGDHPCPRDRRTRWPGSPASRVRSRARRC